MNRSRSIVVAGFMVLFLSPLALAAGPSAATSRPAIRPASQPAQQAASPLVGGAQPPQSYPAAWIPSFQAADRYRPLAMKYVALDIKAAQARPTGPGATFVVKDAPGRIDVVAGRAGQRRLLKQLFAKQQSLHRAAVPPLPPLQTFSVGEVGRLDGPAWRLDGEIKIVQVLGSAQLRGIPPGHSDPLIFKRIRTAGRADGQVISMPGPFIVTGTQTFETAAGGTRTEMVLEPLDMAAWSTAYLVWKAQGKPDVAPAAAR